MSDSIPEEKLAEWEALSRAASLGPWEAQRYREAVPALIAEVRRLRKERKDAVKESVRAMADFIRGRP